MAKLLLEEGQIDVLANFYVHLACKCSQDVMILESLLIAIHTKLGSKEKLAEFLLQEDSDGLKPLDYCMVKTRA